MKKHENDNRFFKAILIVVLSLVTFLLVGAIIIIIDRYKTGSYKIDVRFNTSSVVQLTNKLPISDSIGKNYMGSGIEKGIAEYIEFTVSNPNKKKVKYEVYLTRDNNISNSIRSNYIKLYLTDSKDNPLDGFKTKRIKSYYDLYVFNNKPGSKLLYTGTLGAGKNKHLILRSWVADTYVLSDREETFGFSVSVRIKEE